MKSSMQIRVSKSWYQTVLRGDGNMKLHAEQAKVTLKLLQDKLAITERANGCGLPLVLFLFHDGEGSKFKILSN